MNIDKQAKFNDLTALIVDDEATARMVASRALSQMGFSVSEADDGDTALKLLETLRPNVILLDVEMDRMDGFTTCEQIRKSASMTNTPIIMLTAHDDATSIDSAYRAGATDFATKPINWTLMQHRLRYVLRSAEVVLEKELALRQIHQFAYRDEITNLPNRRAFKEQLADAVANAKTDQNTIAVLYLDIDNFKRVNDSLGHTIGDMLLQFIGNRLRDATLHTEPNLANLQTNDDQHHDAIDVVAARLGGDEFAVLLSNIKHESDAVDVASRIVDSLRLPFLVEGQTLIATPSIGIAVYPRDATDSTGLLKNADTAMYSAKHQGKNRYRCYDSTLSKAAQRRMLLETHLRYALEHNEFELNYQPQIGMTEFEVVGVEALLRWDSEALGPISPVEFIPLAEETGLILSIGEWVLREACEQFMQWHQSSHPIHRMAVNISMSQFNQTDFVDRVAAIISDTAMVPECLELELTESLLAENANAAIETLQNLKALGIALSIDDFGTGYSSLSYLKKFPISRLKIDRSFICDIAHDASDVAIITSVIGMARGLELGVLAEGVETLDQLNTLIELGCDNAQGYLMSKPLQAEMFVDWLINYELDLAHKLNKRSA